MKTVIAIALLSISLILTTPAAAAIGTIVTEDGMNIHFTVQGAGAPTLVFVHGWSCDRGYWVEQMEAFSGDHRVVAIDLAGHGESSQGRRDYTMAAFGADAARVMEALNVKDAILVGHSMGGAVVVEAALAAPHRVQGLVGVDNFQQVGMTISPEMIEGFMSGFEADFPTYCATWVKQMFPADADPELVNSIADDMAAGPAEVGRNAMRHFLDWFSNQATDSLGALPAPLMCINSDLEPTDVEAITAVARGYQLRLMSGKGHFLMREDPAVFNALLRLTIAEMPN